MAREDLPRAGLVFPLVVGVIGADTLLFTLVLPALPRLAEQNDLSDSATALVFGAFPVAQLAGALLAARLVESAGRRPMIVSSTLVLTLATLAFAAATAPALLVVARLLQGLGAGFGWTAGLAAVADRYPQEQLGFRIGLAEALGGGAALAGPIAGGVMVDAIGVEHTFALAAAIPAVLTLPALAMPETRRAGVRPAVALLPALRRLMREPTARAGALALAAVAGSVALVEALLPLDLDARLGLSATAIGLLFAVALAANLLAVPLAGRWSDRHGRRPPIALGGALLAVASAMIGLGSIAWLVPWLVVLGLGWAILAVPSGPLLTQAADDAGMRGAYGVSAGMLSVIFAAGSAAGPLLAAAGRLAFPFWAVGIAAGAGTGVVAALAWRQLGAVPATARGPTSRDAGDC